MDNKICALVAGCDGYIGNALTLRLLKNNYKVVGIDDFRRRRDVKDMGSFSAIPIKFMDEKIKIFKEIGDFTFYSHSMEMEYEKLKEIFFLHKPNVVINLAQQPSAPFSQKSRKHAVETTYGNLIGTLNVLYVMKETVPESQLIQIGSMGEYNPALGIEIPEGIFDFSYNGVEIKNAIFPRAPGSFYHACYDKKTEILTMDGWKYFDKINLNDKIATLNKDKDLLEYQNPSNIFKYNYKGEMIKIDGKRVNVLVTPNHRMFEYSNTTSDLKNWRLTEIDKLYGKHVVFRKGVKNYEGKSINIKIPAYLAKKKNQYTDKKGYLPEINIKSKNFVKFLGWWLTEGHLHKTVIVISQKKEENFDDIMDSIKMLNINRKVWKSKFSNGTIGFSFKSIQFSNYLKQFGLSYDKFIPNEIKNLPKDELKLLIKVMVLGDGSIKNDNFDNQNFTFYTSSERLADDFFEICLKCGYCPSLNRRSEFEYVVYVSHCHTTQILNDKPYSKEYYDGNVYCVEVPNDIIYIRRNGKSIWCGNSKVASTYYIDCACKWWNLKATDIMQGPVFGNWTPEIEEFDLQTRLDSDEAFGTVVNRFIVQAILEEPLTIYGKGKHKRGFLSLNDSIQCLMLAIENPPKFGEYRTWNQLDTVYSMNDVAKEVAEAAIESKITKKVIFSNIETPRVENTNDFYYNPKIDKLKNLGFKPTRTIKDDSLYAFKVLKSELDNLFPLKNVIIPKIKWRI